MRRSTLVLMIASATAAALLAPAHASANSFFVTCAESHVSMDDPIVFPRQPGAAHRHEFFGAASTRAASTVAALERGATSCADRADTAAYWAPTLEVRGIRVRGTLRAYYQRAGKASAAAPPRGLKMLAGSRHAMDEMAMPDPHVAWTCVGRRHPTQSRTVPACHRGERLGAWVKFPDCWDGTHLDSRGHRSHVAYARAARCPATHPVAIMRLALLVTWPVRPRAADMTFGGGVIEPAGFHADFWNTWHQPALRQLRWDCIEVAAPCGEVRR
jgi:hypothetical protein